MFSFNHNQIWDPGIYIDQDNPACHMVVWGGVYSYSTFGCPIVRYTAAYSGKVYWIGYSSNLKPMGPRGAWAPGTNRLMVASTGGNVYSYYYLPGDW